MCGVLVLTGKLTSQAQKLNEEADDVIQELKAQLDAAHARVERQSDDIEDLSKAKLDLEETVMVWHGLISDSCVGIHPMFCVYPQVLQRNVLQFTQENETSRSLLQTCIEDTKRRVHTTSRISGVLSGMDDVFAEYVSST